jgi:plasmid stabilization system protein ParE
MTPYEVAEAAKADVSGTLAFHNAPSRHSALFSLALSQAIRHLSQWPKTGHRRRDLTSQDLCFWTFDDYYIVFRLRTDLLSIVAILHTSRNVARILRSRLRKQPLLT